MRVFFCPAVRANDEHPGRQEAATNLPRERRTRRTRSDSTRGRRRPAPELLLAADFGWQAAGRPIHGRLESEDGGGEPGPRLKIGAVRTRRLAVSEAAARPSGIAYGNPLGGTRESAPAVPVGAPLVARTDVPDAHGLRVYRVAPNGAVIYDRWIEHDSARAEQALTELTPPRRRCAAPSRGAPATRARKRSRSGSPTGRPGGRAPRPDPGRGRHGGGGGAPSPGKAAAHDAPHRHAADDPAVATILTTAHDIHPHHPRFSTGRISTAHAAAAAARKPCRHLRHNALMTAAHADPSRHVSILCALRH